MFFGTWDEVVRKACMWLASLFGFGFGFLVDFAPQFGLNLHESSSPVFHFHVGLHLIVHDKQLSLLRR